ncbi:MAG TPA: protoglobin domain-containing protein, partial [Myxococcota bacterium]|nr:protoglobin domain-containing protein [Myxococcota bacterium]
PHFRRIAEDFYARLTAHEDAHQVFTGPAQIERLKGSLCEWMSLLLAGPWDEAYYQRRARIGRVHVKIGLPQRYMFLAMNGIRIALAAIAHDAFETAPTQQVEATVALDKIIDLELCIMLETYAEAYIDKVQQLERSEKTRLERRLAVSEAQYQEVVEKAEACIATFDSDGHLQLFNRRCEELTGLSRGEVAGRSWPELFIPEALRDRVPERMAQALAGRRSTPLEAEVLDAAGKPRRVRWYLTTVPSLETPILCALGLDVTEEHDATLRARRAERLAVMGTMVAGIAHEIRNPLNSAHLQLMLVQRRLARGQPGDVAGALDAANIVAAEITRLSRLVGEFLDFARPRELVLNPTDVSALVRDVVRLIEPEASAAGLQVVVDAPAEVVAQVDPERMRQVLLNLIRNALEAGHAGGHVRLIACTRDGRACLQVEDDGPGLGLPDGDQAVFEPFVTTKPGGTGLGLTVVQRIVHEHHGTVSVESRPGRTVFTVLLNLAG